MNLRAETMIQYFNFNGDKEDNPAAERPTVGETESFIERMLRNRSWGEEKDTETGRAQRPTSQTGDPALLGSKNYIQQVLANRKWPDGANDRTTTEPYRPAITSEGLSKTDKFKSYIQQILTNRKRGEIKQMKTPGSNTKSPPPSASADETTARRESTPSPLKPPPIQKPLFEQRAASEFTYEKWHQQRLSNMCGQDWQEKYQELHEDIISGRREERYLVYSCPGYRQGCCGYGNRLRALASVFYLAILTGRAFLVDWQIPEPIDRHLVPKGIRWNYSEPLDLCTGPEFRRHYWGTTKSEVRQAQGWIIQDSQTFAKWFTSTNFSTYFEWPVERITTIWYFVEKGIRDNPSLMTRAKQLAITPLLSRLPQYALIGCAFDFLFTKSESVEYQLSRLRQRVRSFQGPVIGIHVRTGDDQFDYYATENDRTWNVNLTRLLRFFECAANVEKNVFGATERNASAVRWFVATDNPRVRTLATKRFPEKVVTSDLAILHLDILLNSTLLNYTVECHYTDGTNTTLECTDVELFNRTIYCANRTNDTLRNTTVFNATEGIISMLVDHFLLAESDFLVLCDSSFGSSAVGLSMRESESYTLGDRGCAHVKLVQRYRRLQFFKK